MVFVVMALTKIQHTQIIEKTEEADIPTWYVLGMENCRPFIFKGLHSLICQKKNIEFTNGFSLLVSPKLRRQSLWHIGNDNLWPSSLSF